MNARKFAIACIAAVVLASPAGAAEAAQAPLAAGKPAGVQQATLLGLSARWVIGLGFTAVGIAAAAGAFDSKSVSSTGTGG